MNANTHELVYSTRNNTKGKRKMKCKLQSESLIDRLGINEMQPWVFLCQTNRRHLCNGCSRHFSPKLQCNFEIHIMFYNFIANRNVELDDAGFKKRLFVTKINGELFSLLRARVQLKKSTSIWCTFLLIDTDTSRNHIQIDGSSDCV